MAEVQRLSYKEITGKLKFYEVKSFKILTK